jgi:hypothetical protein
MRPGYRNIGTGLAIGGALAAFMILGGLALKRGPLLAPLPGQADSVHSGSNLPAVPPPTDSALPSPTYTAIPTIPGIPNLSPYLDLDASPTPDVVALAISRGEVAYTGSLTHRQQAELYRASLRYVRNTVTESKQEAKDINGVGYGDPSNICGPLAIAIMRDAALIPADVIPHDFWLLDPRAPTDKAKLQVVFPPDDYEHLTVPTRLDKVDWLANPLEPGDFLFIWHGSGGNFDHMLVVNRVDQDMRAYAVTNFGTSEGFIIGETMLYDPHDTGAGIFHTWTREKEAILGSTGFGGYEIWRLRSP